MANNASDGNQVTSVSGTIENAATHTSPLLGLPEELIDKMAKRLDTPWLLAMRAASRKLRDDSAYEFRQRYFQRVEISGTSSSVRDLLDMFSSPNLPQAQQWVRLLIVRTPLVRQGWPIDLTHLHNHLAPDPRDIARLLAAMPNLESIRLVQELSYDDYYNHQPDVAVLASPQIFLASLAASSPPSLHLRRLSMIGVRVSGNDLASTLDRYADTLRNVYMNRVALVDHDARPCVLKILLSAERLERFFFGWLRVGNAQKVGFPYEALERLIRSRGAERHSNYATKYLIKITLTSLVKPALELVEQEWQHRLRSA